MDEMFQKLKRGVKSLGMETQTTVDENFNSAKANFDLLCLTVESLKNRIEAHMAHLKGMQIQSDALLADFVTLFSSSLKYSHPLGPFSIEAKQTYAALLKQIDGVEKQMESGSLRRVRGMLDLFTQYRERIKQREQFREDFDYYSAKVKKLHSERDKTLSAGKRESPSDIENRQKTEHKLDSATKSYHDSNSILIKDLNNLWISRQDNLAPIMIDFLSVDKSYANAHFSFVQGLQNLKVPNLSDRVDLKSVPPSSSAPPPSYSSSKPQQQQQQQQPQRQQRGSQPPLPVPPLSNKGNGDGSMSIQDAKNAVAFYQAHQTEVNQAAQFANDHKEELAAAGKFAMANKDQVKSAANFVAQNAPK